ncbi:MAG: hypothetical protein ACKVQB_05310, partial [Bacteroidia bacterium]
IIMSTIWASFGHDITKANPFIKIDADYRYGKDSKKSYVEEQYQHRVYVPFYIYYSFDSIGQKEQIHDELKFEKHYDSIELQGKRYYEVKEITTTASPFGPKQIKIFWAKNVGRIRFETFGGEIWNLVNYHVLQ